MMGLSKLSGSIHDEKDTQEDLEDHRTWRNSERQFSHRKQSGRLFLRSEDNDNHII